MFTLAILTRHKLSNAHHLSKAMKIM